MAIHIYKLFKNKYKHIRKIEHEKVGTIFTIDDVNLNKIIVNAHQFNIKLGRNIKYDLLIIKGNVHIKSNVTFKGTVQLGNNAVIKEKCNIGNKVTIEADTIVDRKCTIENNVFIGFSCYIHPNTLIPETSVIGGYNHISNKSNITNEKNITTYIDINTNREVLVLKDEYI